MTDPKIVQAVAEALHEIGCADDECDGSDMGSYDSDAEAVLDVVEPLIRADERRGRKGGAFL